MRIGGGNRCWKKLWCRLSPWAPDRGCRESVHVRIVSTGLLPAALCEQCAHTHFQAQVAGKSRATNVLCGGAQASVRAQHRAILR